jgi:hypothetical protein
LVVVDVPLSVVPIQEVGEDRVGFDRDSKYWFVDRLA